MARITAGVTTSHVPAIGAAFDRGEDQSDYWAPLFAGYEWSKKWIAAEKPDGHVLSEWLDDERHHAALA